MSYAALLIGLLIGLPASAQTTTPVTWSLHLEVQAPEVIQDQLTSCLNGGLRKLGNVDLVKGQSLFKVSIVAVEIKLGERVTGYTASVVAMDNQSVSMVRLTAKEDFEKVLLEDSGHLMYHGVMNGPPDVADLCNRIVASLDIKVIEAKKNSSIWSQ